MLVTYMFKEDELNKLGDIQVINIENYSFSLPKMYKIEEAKSLILKGIKIIISITPLYHEDELEGVYSLIDELKDAYGFLFQDLGLVKKFNELNIIDKAIYAPETFITNHLDRLYFNSLGIKKFLLSREITLDNIKDIINKKEDNEYFYNSFGYSMLFYSYRPHYTNFIYHYNLNLDLRDRFDIEIKEETRDEFYKAIEDTRGFRIFKDKILNAYPHIKDINNIDYLILDRSFIDDELYFDTISLYKNEITYNEYMRKYNKLFDNGYLFSETGLLKEKK